MRRWPKVLIAVLAAIVVLLILNTVALDQQTKDAEVTVEGGRIIHLQAGDVQVLDSGTGHEPIVLLHCYTCSINWWDELIPLLERDGHRVIAIDLLGHGGSEKPGSGYSMQNQAQLVAGALGQLHVKQATVVGHSLGGAVAVALAEQSPQLVGRLVIVDSDPGSFGSLDLLARAEYVPVLGEALWRVKTGWAIRKGLEQAFAPSFDVPDQFVDDLERVTYTAYDDSHGDLDSFVDESPLDERIRSLDVSPLVIFGSEDQIIDAREALSAYADIPGAQTALIQGSGHSPNVEKPVETARVIERFMRSTTAVSAPHPRPLRPHPGQTRRSSVTASCDDAIIGSGRPDWRKRSSVAGSFGLFGSGRNLQRASRVGRFFETKIPAVLEGGKVATLRVPAGQRKRVGLVYGPVREARTVAAAATRVSFEPCPAKPRTVWPGGLVLADRRSISLELVSSGRSRSLRVG